MATALATSPAASHADLVDGQPRPHSMSLDFPSPDALSSSSSTSTGQRPDISRRHTAFLTAPSRARPLRSSPLAGPSLALSGDGVILRTSEESAVTSAASVSAHSAPAHIATAADPNSDTAKKSRNRLSLGLLRLRSMPSLVPSGSAAEPLPPIPSLPITRPTQGSSSPKRRSWLLPPEHSSSYAPTPPPMARPRPRQRPSTSGSQHSSHTRSAHASPTPTPRGSPGGSPATSLRGLPRPASIAGGSAPPSPTESRRKSYLDPGSALLTNTATDPEANWLTVSAPPRFSRVGIPLHGVVMPVPANSREGRQARMRAVSGSRPGSADGSRPRAASLEPSLSELARQFEQAERARASSSSAHELEIQEEPRARSGFQVVSRRPVSQIQASLQPAIPAYTPSAIPLPPPLSASASYSSLGSLAEALNTPLPSPPISIAEEPELGTVYPSACTPQVAGNAQLPTPAQSMHRRSHSDDSAHSSASSLADAGEVDLATLRPPLAPFVLGGSTASLGSTTSTETPSLASETGSEASASVVPTLGMLAEEPAAVRVAGEDEGDVGLQAMPTDDSKASVGTAIEGVARAGRRGKPVVVSVRVQPAPGKEKEARLRPQERESSAQKQSKDTKRKLMKAVLSEVSVVGEGKEKERSKEKDRGSLWRRVLRSVRGG